jgi:hypothetical protein
MTPLKDVFRIWLNFLDRLECVHAVTAPIMVSGVPESVSVILSGPVDLEDFLAAASIDSYLEASGDLAAPTYTLRAARPESIVQSLKSLFDHEDAIQLKIVSGERISGSELLARVPVSTTVCALSVTPSEGLRRVRAWKEKLTA